MKDLAVCAFSMWFSSNQLTPVCNRKLRNSRNSWPMGDVRWKCSSRLSPACILPPPTASPHRAGSIPTVRNGIPVGVSLRWSIYVLWDMPPGQIGRTEVRFEVPTKPIPSVPRWFAVRGSSACCFTYLPQGPPGRSHLNPDRLGVV